MYNIINYAYDARKSFQEAPVTEPDSLIFSTLAYLRFPQAVVDAGWTGIRLSDLFRAEYFADMQGVLSDKYIRLLTACAASPRFRTVRVCAYRSHTDIDTEKQFASVCFRLCPGYSFVAFRGTDSSFVGWREDFNLALKCPVPSQQEAAAFLREAAIHLGGRLAVGGHSKGGNLAVYACAMNTHQLNDCLEAVYSHDGPGFLPETLNSNGFSRIRGRIHKTIPQSSVVGLLLEQETDYRIIRSVEHGFRQHQPFSWSIAEGDFMTCEDLTVEARLTNSAVMQWVNTLSAEEFLLFIDTFFSTLSSTEVSSFAELSDHRRELLPVLLRAASQLSPETKKFLRHQLLELAACGVRVMPELIKEAE